MKVNIKIIILGVRVFDVMLYVSLEPKCGH